MEFKYPPGFLIDISCYIWKMSKQSFISYLNLRLDLFYHWRQFSWFPKFLSPSSRLPRNTAFEKIKIHEKASFS